MTTPNTTTHDTPADTRSPFERAVALVAADRNTTPDTARAALIGEAVQWIHDQLYTADDRKAFNTARSAARRGLADAAMEHYGEADRALDLAMAAEAADRDAADLYRIHERFTADHDAIIAVAEAVFPAPF